MVRFENVSKAYGDHRVIRTLNLSVERGRITVLIGPSGCGKTTTLKMANRLIEPSEGVITLDGKDISQSNPVLLRRGIGYVIQQIGLFPNMTIEQNIEVVPRLLKWSVEQRRARTRELLEMVRMDPDQYMPRYPNELSGGQQQRIGVLRALAASPPLLLMDEPFGALDPISRESLQDEIRQLQKTLGITVLFVTHDIDEAVKLADEIVLMNDGKIVQQGAPEHLLSQPVNRFVREFIGKKRVRENYDVDLVSEIMNPRVVSVTKDRGFSESLDMMRQRKVDTLIITDDKDHLEGMVTVADIRSAAGQLDISKIGDLEITPAPSISVNAQAREAFDMLINEKHPLIVAVDNRNHVRGLVSKTSLVKALAAVVWREDDDV